MKKVLNKKGFTLIELMVVMAIIAVLAVLIVGAIGVARRTATETQHRSNAKTIQTALEAGYAQYKAYCGATGQPVECTTKSLADISSSDDLNVTLATSSTAGTCGGQTPTTDGGGAVTAISATSYTIRIQNSGCTAILTNDDITVN